MLWIGFLEKVPDRRDFRDRCAVVKNERRHLLARIDCLEPIRELFLLTQIHWLERD